MIPKLPVVYMMELMKNNIRDATRRMAVIDLYMKQEGITPEDPKES